MKRRRKGRCWSYSAGPHGGRVLVYERTPGGPLWARQGDERVALGHRDQELAKDYAHDEAAKLQRGREERLAGVPTVRRIFALYLRERSPEKGGKARWTDEAEAKMWRLHLGSDKDLSKLTTHELRTFLRRRQSGELTPKGVVEDAVLRRPVRARTVELSFVWLRAVIHWAMEERDEQDRFLMTADPTRGFDVPREKNPLRPVASEDRYRALLEVAPSVHPFLRPLFVLANEQAGRLSAIRRLQYRDVRLDVGEFGSVTWRAEHDKNGVEREAPLTPEAREALLAHLRAYPGLGSAWLFPAPGDRTKPVSSERAGTWLRRAEKRAGLAHLKGGCWHPLRRKFATEHGHLSTALLAKAGGWKSSATIEKCYLQPSQDMLLEALLDRRKLRERAR